MLKATIHIAAAFLSLAGEMLYGGLTYQVTLSPNACHEIQLPRLTKPREIGWTDSVNLGYFHYELRSAGETKIYIGVVTGIGRLNPMDPVFSVREKYAVDLRRTSNVRRLDETLWQSALPLSRATEGNYLPKDPEDRGIRVGGGPLLEKSGPRWAGVGEGPVKASMSWTMSRAAVNSWDGYDITYSILDPTAVFKRDKVAGLYWIDIYETLSGASLVKIQGSFRNVHPFEFQGYATAWYADRFYVMPLNRDMRRLLICDADLASRKDNKTLKERE